MEITAETKETLHNVPEERQQTELMKKGWLNKVSQSDKAAKNSLQVTQAEQPAEDGQEKGNYPRQSDQKIRRSRITSRSGVTAHRQVCKWEFEKACEWESDEVYKWESYEVYKDEPSSETLKAI